MIVGYYDCSLLKIFILFFSFLLKKNKYIINCIILYLDDILFSISMTIDAIQNSNFSSVYVCIGIIKYFLLNLLLTLFSYRMLTSGFEWFVVFVLYLTKLVTHKNECFHREDLQIFADLNLFKILSPKSF